MKKYYSTTEAANMLGISRIAVFKKIKSGVIKAEKVGRNYVIPASEIASSELELTEEGKKNIEKAVKKTVKEYGETLKLLGQE